MLRKHRNKRHLAASSQLQRRAARSFIDGANSGFTVASTVTMRCSPSMSPVDCVSTARIISLRIDLKFLTMFPFDSSKKLSFSRYISDGDLVILYERHDNMKAVKVSESGVLQNRFGVFKHSEWIGKPFGSKVFSNKGGFVYLLAPTAELWTLVLSHRTQILYIADISFVVMYLEIVPGCLVLESGTGSGSLTTSLARAIAPNGHVYTFDFHEQRAASAREDFERTGLSSLVTVGVRDIQGEGFPDEFLGRADSVFLDLPQPWLAIPSASKMLKQDGVLCSFSPCIEQVQKSCETLRSDFTDIRTFEVLLHTYEVREGNVWSWQDDDGSSMSLKSCKKRQRSTNEPENASSLTIMARRNGESREQKDIKNCLLHKVMVENPRGTLDHVHVSNTFARFLHSQATVLY
ncbi:unnamed protein product [Fraxinus pennsylvanica]|uniref:tRNA (adenine(58)-N(1))-methyltransferase n=1 Tax=Fraxinus pennsylvanica TaxID=56036 RepID=A0AAD2DP54_9LAMI|nr:unnamed protein product [Fraxinus pennsylvanica]